MRRSVKRTDRDVEGSDILPFAWSSRGKPREAAVITSGLLDYEARVITLRSSVSRICGAIPPYSCRSHFTQWSSSSTDMNFLVKMSNMLWAQWINPPPPTTDRSALPNDTNTPSLTDAVLSSFCNYNYRYVCQVAETAEKNKSSWGSREVSVLQSVMHPRPFPRKVMSRWRQKHLFCNAFKVL